MPRSSKKYTDPETYEQPITPSALKRMGKSRQIEVMRRWFEENFEDPVHVCPYDSEEGGYLYLHGGPFDACEELESEFEGIASDHAINELVEELEGECWEWSGRDKGPEEDIYEIETVLDESIPKDAMLIKLDKLEKLLDEKPFQRAELQDFQGIMIFSFCITTLETYLATIFIRSVLLDNKYRVKYIQSEQKLSEQKFSLADVFDKHTLVDNLIKAQLAQTSFHNLEKAKDLFKNVFGVDLGDVERLKQLVRKRHNFVHHAGQDPIKGAVSTTIDEIKELISLVKSLCSDVDLKMLLVLPAPF